MENCSFHKYTKLVRPYIFTYFLIKTHLSRWNGRGGMTSSRWVRTVRMNLIHGGQVGACRDRKPARVSPASGRWYSASHNASTRITARWHASLPMRRRLHSGSIMPRCHAKSGAAIHSLKDRDTCNKFNFRIFQISFFYFKHLALYICPSATYLCMKQSYS